MEAQHQPSETSDELKSGLSAEQFRKERSIAFALVVDVFAVGLIVVSAIVSGSLTILSEAVRAILMLGLSIYLFMILRSVHREGLGAFEFGVVKLEHFASGLLGIGLIVSGFWMAGAVTDTLFAAREAATPLGLVIAALSNAFNALLCVINWLVVWSASGDRQTQAFRAQLHGRRIMMTSALFLQLTLTAAALSGDPLISLAMDAAGAAFVSVLMLRNGLGLVSRAVPVLLDARAPAPVRVEILERIARAFPGTDILALRTRHVGDEWVADATLAADPALSLSDLRRRCNAVETRLRQDGLPVTLTIAPEVHVPATPPGSSDTGFPGEVFP